MKIIFNSYVYLIFLVGYIILRDKKVKDIYIHLGIGCILIFLLGV